MKVFRKLSVLVLLFAVLMLVMGFTVLSAPRDANAARPRLCCVWVCTDEAPYVCWHVCFRCPH